MPTGRFARATVACALALAAGCNPPAGDAADPPGSAASGGSAPGTVRLTGDGYRWLAAYPGQDGAWGTADDRVSADEVRIPADRPVRLELASRDYIYTLELDALDVHELAMPERLYSVALPRLDRGTYPFRGDQLCGYTHETLMGEIVALPREEFERWLAGLPRRPQEVYRGGTDASGTS